MSALCVLAVTMIMASGLERGAEHFQHIQATHDGHLDIQQDEIKRLGLRNEPKARWPSSATCTA